MLAASASKKSGDCETTAGCVAYYSRRALSTRERVLVANAYAGPLSRAHLTGSEPIKSQIAKITCPACLTIASQKRVWLAARRWRIAVC